MPDVGLQTVSGGTINDPTPTGSQIGSAFGALAVNLSAALGGLEIAKLQGNTAGAGIPTLSTKLGGGVNVGPGLFTASANQSFGFVVVLTLIGITAWAVFRRE